MLKRIIFILAFFPVAAVMGVLVIASLFYWMITGKDLLWIVTWIANWMTKNLLGPKSKVE